MKSWAASFTVKTQERLDFARLYLRDKLLRAGAPDDARIQALFCGRGILEYYPG